MRFFRKIIFPFLAICTSVTWVMPYDKKAGICFLVISIYVLILGIGDMLKLNREKQTKGKKIKFQGDKKEKEALFRSYSNCHHFNKLKIHKKGD